MQMLKRTEWIFFGLVFAAMFSIYSISKLTSYRSLERTKRHSLPKEFAVEISGHVRHPGAILVQEGESLRSALRCAKLRPNADLSGLDLDQALTAACSFTIPVLQIIFINIEGEVKQPLRIELPAGSRICDLKGKVELTEKADRAFFRRRRILENGDVISIPAKRNKLTRSGIKMDLKGACPSEIKEF